VTVATGKGKANEQVITIQGYVNPIPMGVMEVDPRKVPVGTLSAGKENVFALKVKNAGDAPMKVSAVKSRKFHRSYWEGDVTVPAGHTAELELKLQPAKVGRFLDIIMIYSDARNDIGKGYKAVLLGTTK